MYFSTRDLLWPALHPVCRYDSLTGVPCTQKTVAFEKASVLFNIGGLYTQIGTRQDRSSQVLQIYWAALPECAVQEGLDAAVDNFLRAAGTFQFIIENFSHAPSSDLGPECLNTLVQMMLGQARECLLEKAVLALAGDASQMELCLELSQVCNVDFAVTVAGVQEAAHVSSQYEEAVQAAAPCIPLSWVSQPHCRTPLHCPLQVCLLQVKREHYRALADYFLALPLAADPVLPCVAWPVLYPTLQAVPLTARAADCLAYLHDLSGQPECERPAVPRSRDQRRHLARAHLRYSNTHSLNQPVDHKLCSQRGAAAARGGAAAGQDVLRAPEEGGVRRGAETVPPAQSRTVQVETVVLGELYLLYTTLNSELEEEDDFQEVFSPPPVLPATRFQLSLSYPDFSAHRVVDLFRALGPEAVFSAKHDW